MALGRNRRDRVRDTGEIRSPRALPEVPGTLAGMRAGERAVIGEISCPRARAQALRFGVGEGALVRCITTIPGGPVVLGYGRQEIAVGHGLAQKITLCGAEA